MKRILILALALSVAGFGLSPAFAADLKPDSEGYIRDWLMLAPIHLADENAGADQIDKEQVKGEAALKPSAGEKAKAGDRELTWKAVQSKAASFDFNEILGSMNEQVAGYMVVYLVCENELTDLTLLMGSNDQGKLYLNGKMMVKATDPRGLEMDSDKVEKVTLNKGVNVIVFKVINETNNWQGSLRFKDKAGKPVTALKVALAP